MTDDLAVRRKRLLYRARHRGTQEGDLLIGGFADRYIQRLDAHGLDQFEALIAEPEPNLLDWLSGRTDPPTNLQGDVFDLIVEYKNGIPGH